MAIQKDMVVSMDMIKSILEEFRVAETLHSRKYISDDKYDEYKKEVAICLIHEYKHMDKRPWYKRWFSP
jgi:hypothetical protein